MANLVLRHREQTIYWLHVINWRAFIQIVWNNIWIQTKIFLSVNPLEIQIIEIIQKQKIVVCCSFFYV